MGVPRFRRATCTLTGKTLSGRPLGVIPGVSSAPEAPLRDRADWPSNPTTLDAARRDLRPVLRSPTSCFIPSAMSDWAAIRQSAITSSAYADKTTATTKASSSIMALAHRLWSIPRCACLSRFGRSQTSKDGKACIACRGGSAPHRSGALGGGLCCLHEGRQWLTSSGLAAWARQRRFGERDRGYIAGNAPSRSRTRCPRNRGLNPLENGDLADLGDRQAPAARGGKRASGRRAGHRAAGTADRRQVDAAGRACKLSWGRGGGSRRARHARVGAH